VNKDRVLNAAVSAPSENEEIQLEGQINQFLWLSLPLREALWADLVDAIPESIMPPNSKLLIYRVRQMSSARP
jgi:hypothetical protein